MPDLTGCTLRKTDTNRNATCRHCKTTRRINVVRRRWYRPAKPGFYAGGFEVMVFERVKINGLGDFNSGAAALLTCCESGLSFEPIRGRVTDHKCDAKCRNAKGGHCDCSCGGENHGVDHC